MSKIVFFCIPAHGHTNPTLGVVKKLTSLGHEVWYYSYNIMEEKIKDAGAKFISCDKYDAQQDLKPEDGARVGKDLAFSTKILVDTTLALDEIICRDMRELNPDCIVADSMAVWGKAAAKKLHIPFISSTTTFAFNRYSSRIMKQGPKELFSMLCSMPAVKRQIKRLQNQGYPIRSILDIIGNDEQTHTIVYTSPEFQPCSETFSKNYAFVGPSVRPASCEVTKRYDKLIYFSMGTVNNNLLSLYQNCIAAFRDTSFQVILSVGDLVEMSHFSNLPDNIEVYRQVDQIAVLKKADVFFTHCGMNSVNESLYFGVPLIMLPQTAEQDGVCTRVEQLGAGIRLKKATRRSMAEGVKKIFTIPSYKENVRILSQSFMNCPGAAGAAKKILEVCQKNE